MYQFCFEGIFRHDFFHFQNVVFQIIPHFCNFSRNYTTQKIWDFTNNKNQHFPPNLTSDDP